MGSSEIERRTWLCFALADLAFDLQAPLIVSTQIDEGLSVHKTAITRLNFIPPGESPQMRNTVMRMLYFHNNRRALGENAPPPRDKVLPVPKTIHNFADSFGPNEQYLRFLQLSIARSNLTTRCISRIHTHTCLKF